MNLLCVAVQNSQTLVGRYDGADLLEHWRVSTDDRRTSDDWGLLLVSLLSRGAEPTQVDSVCVCSAVPAALRELRTAMAGYLPDARTVIVGPGVKSGLPVLTDNPREVGTDRIANAVAALDRFGGPCVVVDFGTATTFDVINAAGQYVGGAIAPGIGLSMQALSSTAAQLRQVELVAPRSVIAKNTVEALQSGAVFGFAGQVDGIVARITDELLDVDGPYRGGRTPKGIASPCATVEVVATGELASVAVDHCATVTRREPWLTLDGLRIIFERNA